MALKPLSTNMALSLVKLGINFDGASHNLESFNSVSCTFNSDKIILALQQRVFADFSMLT